MSVIMLVPLVAHLLATSRPAQAYTPVNPTFFRAYEDFLRIIDSDTARSNPQRGRFRRHLVNKSSRYLHYDRPRHRPKRREDIAPFDPIEETRFVNYGGNGHPYEKIRRLRERRTQLSVGDAKIAGLQEPEADIVNDPEVNRIISEGNASFRPLRIHFDTTELDQWSFQSTRSAARVNYLVNHVLPRMAQTWSSALAVIPVAENLRIDYNYCPFGDPLTSPSLQPEGVPNADLVIYVTANSAVCTDENFKVLASAFSCFWDQFERPIAGTIDFCLDMIDQEDENPIADQAGLNESKSAETTMSPEEDKALKLAVGTAIHEIGHVLGVTSSDMLFFYDSKTGHPRTPTPIEKEVVCMTGEKKVMWVPDETTLAERYTKRGVRYFEITLPTVRQVVRNQFNCQRMTGAPLENQPTGEDCFGSHFDERYFFTENLSAVLGGVPEMLSSLTLGLLHDSGWYVPDYSEAMISPFGHNAGCEFVEDDCIVDGEIPEYSKGSFCNSEYRFDNGKFMGAIGCDPTHTSMGICDLVDYGELGLTYTPPSEKFQYFPNRPNLGGLMDRVDYCPTFSIDTATCQEVPGRLEKLLLPQLEYFATEVESSAYNARCFNTDAARPICLEAECDDTNFLVNVKVGTETLTCYFDGQTHLIPGTDVTFECPKIALICPK
ncbi:hypothetical protein ACHAXS_013072 [Conticribra weissflogii]